MIALLLMAIQKASAQENSIRLRHPTKLHLRWTRRLLAVASARLSPRNSGSVIGTDGLDESRKCRPAAVKPSLRSQPAASDELMAPGGGSARSHRCAWSQRGCSTVTGEASASIRIAFALWNFRRASVDETAFSPNGVPETWLHSEGQRQAPVDGRFGKRASLESRSLVRSTLRGSTP